MLELFSGKIQFFKISLSDHFFGNRKARKGGGWKIIIHRNGKIYIKIRLFERMFINAAPTLFPFI